MELITDARAVIEVDGAGYYEAELCRMTGEIHVIGGDGETGEACFQQAIDLSRRRSARSFELRAAMCLARLWHKGGKTADARLILGETYSWFTEGFGTPDLCDARELLKTLA
jgi:predicted ATPase